jgi:hypothetical protein
LELRKQGEHKHLKFKFFARVPDTPVSEDALIEQQQLYLPLTRTWSQLFACNKTM